MNNVHFKTASDLRNFQEIRVYLNSRDMEGLDSYLNTSIVSMDLVGEALLDVVRTSDLVGIKMLVKAGVDVEYKEAAALQYSLASLAMHAGGCWEESFNVVRLLIELGAQWHGYGGYAIRMAAGNGNLEIIHALVDMGLNVKKIGFAALREGAANGYIEIVNYLIQCGVVVSSDEHAAVKCSAQKGKLEMVQFLIGEGADIDIAIEYAKKKPKVLHWLVRYQEVLRERTVLNDGVAVRHKAIRKSL